MYMIKKPCKLMLIFLLIWTTLSLTTSAEAVCSESEPVHWIIPPAESSNTDNDNHVGKQWNIDCRYNGFEENDVILLQGQTERLPWRKRHPDGVNLIQKGKIFTLLSLNGSDIGYYYCKVCDKTKYVGRLSSDTSLQTLIVYPRHRDRVRLGSNITYTCNIRGIYQMSWYMVADNGSRTLLGSRDDSYWKRGWRYTRHRLVISNFTKNDENLYMCLIYRAGDNYTDEKEVYPSLQKPSLPIHWYYTSFSKNEIEGHLMRVVLHVYICHLPVIVNLMVFEPVKGIRWRRNFTASQSTPLTIDGNSMYGIKLKMHISSDRKLEDHLHVMAVLVNLTSSHTWEVMNQKFDTKAQCHREKCNWATTNSLHCPRYLDDLDEKLNATFMLTLKDPCTKRFSLQIRDRGASKNAEKAAVLLDKVFENNSQERMLLKGFKIDKISSNIQGRVMFSQCYLTLNIDEKYMEKYKVKVLLDMPDTDMRGKFVIMEGDFTIVKSKCRSAGRSGDDRTKTIAIVIILLFAFGLLVFFTVWMYRRRRSRSHGEMLLTSMEDETL